MTVICMVAIYVESNAAFNQTDLLVPRNTGHQEAWTMIRFNGSFSDEDLAATFRGLGRDVFFCSSRCDGWRDA